MIGGMPDKKILVFGVAAFGLIFGFGFILGYCWKPLVFDHTTPPKSFMKMKSLGELNSLNFDSFIQNIGNIIEHNPMVFDEIHRYILNLSL